MGKFSRLVGAILLCGVGMAVATAVVLVGLEVLVEPGWTAKTTPSDLDDFQPLPTRSVVYARDGSVLALLHAEENRAPVSLNLVPPHVVRAVLDAEDDRFFQHGAVDLRALGRALAANVESGSVSEGGSTITQQLVKVSLLGSKQDLKRKVQEITLALRLESTASKDEILERYLNTVYFGNGAYGLQAAAERYFATDVDQLTVGQGVLLASMIRNPVWADPYVDGGARAIERRAAVVDRMVQLGHLTPEEADAVKAEALPPPPPERPATGSDYFTEEVKQQLLNDPRLGETLQERNYAVFKGGLAIHTTLDPGWQRMAENAVASTLPDTKGRFNAALVSVEPGTGAVRALVGGPDFSQKKFNLATGSGRPTGSAFKVFTLIAALESGYSPRDTISGSSPCSIPNPGGTPNPWKPSNVEGSAGGTLSLTDATAQSVNCAYARLVEQIGPEKVADVARRMGVTNNLPPNLSITLGVDNVSPLQMAGAYATLASDGMHYAPYFIERVDGRDGKLLFGTKQEPTEAIAPLYARTVNQMLTQVVQRGTARAAGVPGWTVAGKTGTSEENKNAWFVGYTPTLATAIWMGNPDAEISMYNVGGIRVYGGTYPARIFSSYMREVVKGMAPVPFLPPEKQITGSKYRGDRQNEKAEAAVEAEEAPQEVEIVEETEVFTAPPEEEFVAPALPDPFEDGGPPPAPTAPDLPENPTDFIPSLRDRPQRPRLVANVFHELLRVQDHDTAADRLRHRRESLPELAELSGVEESLTALAATLEETVARRDEVARQERRFEDELGSIEAKIRELESRMYSGAVTVPRELQAMDEELQALRRRRSTLEDSVLETMGEREPIDAEVVSLEQTRADLEEARIRLTVAVAEAQAAIDGELGRELEARSAAAAGLPEDLTRLYEQLRARLDGIGAARLVNGRCGGCHLALPATELDRLRREPADTLERCEQCGRLLVR